MAGPKHAFILGKKITKPSEVEVIDFFVKSLPSHHA